MDARGLKTFHHYTDDVVSHPHSPAHHLGERSDPYHAMGKSETKKAGSYRTQLLQAPRLTLQLPQVSVSSSTARAPLPR